MKIRKQTILKIMNVIFWILIGSGVTFLLVSAVKKEMASTCKGIIVQFNDRATYRMLDQQEVLNTVWPLGAHTYPIGKSTASVDMRSLEEQLERNPWVRQADFYFDHNAMLHVSIQQRKPVARVFTHQGNSFFLDDQYMLLPVKLGSRISLPVFTNFYVDPAKATQADSMLLARVVSLSRFIQSDSLWMAQIEEVAIRSDRSLEATVQMGDQVVQLGYRRDWEKMFGKLQTLYRHIGQEGHWSKYATIDLQYKDQIVCVRNESARLVADSIPSTDSTHIQKTVLNNPSKQ
ncbi:MAG: cell division protein FtsQ/DivIB [Chitinophagaceae bacterium]|jgi:cell division protein FtsQ